MVKVRKGKGVKVQGELLREPRVILVANFKGGVGKSSVAANLACYFAELGETEAVDLDILQGDLERFCKRRGIVCSRVDSPDHLVDHVQGLVRSGRSVILDSPPGESVLTRAACLMADAVVMPVRPGANDAAAIGRLMDMVAEIRVARNDLKVFSLCNFYSTTTEARLMSEILQQMSNSTFLGKLWTRKDYSSSIGNGVPVWEYAAGRPAADEMRALCGALERLVQ